MQGIDQHQAKDTSKLPFQGAVGVDEIIVHSEWVVAWERVSEALSAPGVVALVGTQGAGKTLFLQTFARELQHAGWDVDLLQQGSAARSLDPQIILVDEADRLPKALLRSLAARGRPCVFAGLPALAAHLAELPVHVTVVTLAPLPPREVGSFLGEQLARSNQPQDLLQPDAVAALAHYSEGEPARLQLLAGLAVFMARLEDAPRVSAAHVLAATTVQTGVSLGASDVGDESDEASDELGSAVDEPPTASVESFPRIAVASAPATSGWRKRTVVALALVGVTAGVLAAFPLAAYFDRSSQAGPGHAQAIRTNIVPNQAPRPTPPVTPSTASPGAVTRQPEPSAPTAAPSTMAPTGGHAARSLPAGVQPRVLISYRRDSAAAKRRGEDLASLLHSQGLDVQGPVADPSRLTDFAVDYFFTNDAATAASIADEAGESGRAQLLAPATLPRPGTIQILIAGSASR